jgi:hypothetical protein
MAGKQLEQISLMALNSLVKGGRGEMVDLVVEKGSKEDIIKSVVNNRLKKEGCDFFTIGESIWTGGYQMDVNTYFRVPVIYGKYLSGEKK